MMRDDNVFIAHILDALHQIIKYSDGLDYDTFMTTRMAQDAIIQQFEVIGEATKNLSDEYRLQHASVPWKDLAGFRDKLIHRYFGVDISLVWSSVVDDVPMLLDELSRI